MALYQPTNQIPSSYTKGTVDAVNDKMEISWQVNGNSAMTAFQIDFYLNDANSTPVTSTGRLEDNCPFYGTDRFGRPQFFPWNSGVSWEDKGFTNGNEYKYKITQWYKSDENIASVMPTVNLDADTTYYFALPSGGYLKFIPAKAYSANSTKFYYNIGKRKAWSVANNTLALLPMAYLDSLPTDATVTATMTADSVASTEDFVVQTSFSVFITMSEPTLTLYLTDKNFENAVPMPDNLSTSIGYFHAEYEQEQGLPIRWIRWQVATANNGIVGEILADTGDIYTPTLNYEYNGFFNGSQYAIRCLGLSESEQSTNSPNSTNDGWIFFSIDIPNQGKYTGNITATCLKKENAVLVEWDKIEKINGTTEGIYTINENSVSLEQGAQITWDNILGAPMSFRSPWTVVWRGNLYGSKPTIQVTFEGVPNIPLNNELERTITGRSITGTVANSSGKYESEVTITLSTDWGIPYGSNITLVNESGTGSVTYSTSSGESVYQYNIILYSTEPNTQIRYSIEQSFYKTYYKEISYNLPMQVSGFTPLSEVTSYKLSIEEKTISAILYGTNTENDIRVFGNAYFDSVNSYPQGNLFSIKAGAADIMFSREGENLNLNITDTNGFSLSKDIVIPPLSQIATISLDDTQLKILFHSLDVVPDDVSYSFEQTFVDISYTQEPINSITVYGGMPQSEVYSISAYEGNSSAIVGNYYNINFKPSTTSDRYSLYMTANMLGSIDGSVGSALQTGFRIYRQELGKNNLMPVATLPGDIASFKDFGIVSRKAYAYSVYVYDSRDAFMTSVSSNNIATNFNTYSLLVCDYDEENDEYHVRKQYLFALNLSTGSVGNNNNPTLNANFTRYPTRMPSTQNYTSGTLQGLIGAIYTVPALIEQIGNYKWTAKPSTMDYFDSVDLEHELYDLSTAPYQLFLRDMKGRLRMIATNSAITMTTNIKQKQQSISISFPWVEIGDASDVTIIQTPGDYGWNNDNQVLDVSLDVDVETGELSATYPYPYNGTKFYLTGVNKETLTAKTPLGVTPAQFDLSETATQPDDGELNATVKVNSEDN